MNSLKNLLTTSVAAMILAGPIQAADNTGTIDITGSTAFRSSAHSAILTALFNETYAYTGGTASSADQVIYRGNLGSAGGPLVTVRTNWSGSAEGIGDLDAPTDRTFLPTNTAMSAGGTGNTAVGNDPAFADLAFSDVFQNATNFTATGLEDNIVAIVPFKFVVNAAGFADGITNMTPQLFASVWTTGAQPVALFSGDAADENIYVYPTGRNSGSGTRITTFAETGFGIGSTTVQYEVTVSSGTVTNLVPFASTAGYGSGSNVSAVVGANAVTNFGGYLVSYLGLPDAATAISNGAAEMTYNGIPYSPENVYNGKYTFWGYQHLYAKPGTNGSGTTIGTLADLLVTNINANPGSAGLSNALMRVSRGEDGGTVGPIYFP